jgi:hypothetical protein
MRVLLLASLLAAASAQSYNSAAVAGYSGGSCDACRSTGGSKTKIKSLTLRYTGSNTGASNNDQGDAWGFTGNPGSFGGDQVTIRAYSNKGNYGTYTVSPGDTFLVTASNIDANTYF